MSKPRDTSTGCVILSIGDTGVTMTSIGHGKAGKIADAFLEIVRAHLEHVAAKDGEIRIEGTIADGAGI